MTLSAHDDAQQPDGALIALAHSGKRQAFDVLMRRHEPRMTNLARRTMGNNSDAEDAVQETLLTAFEKSATFEGRSEFETWVFGILKCHYGLGKARHLGKARNKMRLVLCSLSLVCRLLPSSFHYSKFV